MEQYKHVYQSGSLPCEGWCGPCENKNATRQRQNTCYHDDNMNWVTLCPECMKSCDEYWEERWKEYYSMIQISFYDSR